MKNKIVITAGHGGKDPGAISLVIIDGKLTKLQESKLALSLRNHVVYYLRKNGIQVASDGEGVNNLSLSYAIRLAKQSNLAIEFHFNAGGIGAKRAKGIEVLCAPQNKLLAQRLASAIHDVTDSPLRGDKGYKPENGGQHSRLGYVRAGGLVVEVEFITNPSAIKTYLAKEEAVAKAIAQVITAQVEG